MLHALLNELQIRKEEFQGQIVETIYFGGGTPSLLSTDEIKKLLDAISKEYKVSNDPEITLEANPDDLSSKQIKALANSPVNRLSIGVQSFFEEDLLFMNRAHNVKEAKACLEEATQYFNNISIDLIYGIPNATNEQWLENIRIALSYDIPHISSYALTVEPKTALAAFIKKGLVDDVDDQKAEAQFHLLISEMHKANFTHYELSNFGKEGFFSLNNTAYWQGKPYLGIGPSAHSFDGKKRSWNVRNNSKYIKAILSDELPSEIELLSKTDRYNECVMTGLRTIWGVSLPKVEKEFGNDSMKFLLEQSDKYIKEHLLYIEDDKLLVTEKGKFLIDGIASNLFKLN